MRLVILTLLQLILSEVTTVTTDPMRLVDVDGTAMMIENVHVNQWGDAEGVVNIGSSGSENESNTYRLVLMLQMRSMLLS